MALFRQSQLKKISPGVKIENDEIQNVLLNEVLKKEVLEGEKSDIARKKINKILNPSVKKTSPVDTQINDLPIIEKQEEVNNIL